jgi:hypothetical protein
MFGAELGFPELQRLLEERQGQVPLPGSLIRLSEVVHTVERVGMFGTELGFAELQRLLEERQGQVALPGIMIRQGEVVHAGERAAGPSCLSGSSGGEA